MDDTETPIFQLIYSSAATEPFDDDALIELLTRSRASNTAAGVTGMLLYDEGSFLQILEGPEEAVREAYERIGRDPRHTDTTLLYRATAESRQFEDWAMGFARPSKQAKERLAGWSEFLQTGFRGDADADAEKAQKLLFAFRDGRFRQTA